MISHVYVQTIIWLTYLHQKEAYDESGALAVAHFPVVEGVSLDDVKKRLLSQAIFLFEKLVFRIRPGYVSSYHFFTRWFCLCEISKIQSPL